MNVKAIIFKVENNGAPVKAKSSLTVQNLLFWWSLFLTEQINPLTPKIWLLILPSSCYIFP